MIFRSKMLRILFTGLLLFSGDAQAKEYYYYGKDFYQNLDKTIAAKSLKDSLYNILKKTHVFNANDYDKIVGSCPADSSCYRHLYHSYKSSRKFLFGYLDLKKDKEGYFVKDVYCNKVLRDSDFRKRKGLGPWKIPDNQVVNTEHTWPQSRFSHKESSAYQRSDLHALYPVLSKSNSLRSNLDFREIVFQTSSVCDASQKGKLSKSQSTFYFEPPSEHKGNVARSLFYFAVRYRAKIKTATETILKKWHREDPVDSEEVLRHEKIFEYQRVRNPFVDHPELVSQISDF